MKKVLKTLVVLTGLLFSSVGVQASLKDDIEYIESVTPSLKVCEGCSVIQNVLFSNYDEKTAQATINLKVLSNKDNLLQIDLPLKSLSIVDAKINGVENNFISIIDNTEPLLFSAVPKGESNLSFRVKIIDNKIPLLFQNAHLDIDGKSSKLSIITLDNQKFLIKDAAALNTVVNNKNNDIKTFTLNSKPVFTVRRDLILDKEWKLKTTVESMFKNTNGYIDVDKKVSIPLLPGERIITNNIESSNNLVNVNLDGKNNVSWESIISPISSISVSSIGDNVFQTLSINKKRDDWFYSIVKDGKDLNTSLVNLWPSEKIDLLFMLPSSKKGETTIINKVYVTKELFSNKVVTTSSLSISSAIGGTYEIDRGNDVSKIKSVKKGEDEEEVDIKESGQKLTLFLNVGENLFKIETEEDTEPTFKESNPKWDFGVPVYNYFFEIDDHTGRWVWWIGGDMVKSSVLLVGYVLLALIISMTLAKYQIMFGGLTWSLIIIGLMNIHYGFILVLMLAAILISLSQVNKIKMGVKSLIFSLFVIIVILIIGVVFGVWGYRESFIISPFENKYELIWMTDVYTNNNAYMLSLPYMVYQFAMFAWSIWLAFIIIKISTIVFNQIKKIKSVDSQK